ncbi:InlB B-repeat-containing protein [Actinophytocola sp.]|uniref:InlB B-repeat-containing protein n=1 Tax=Actinophytocola sp. TaxID=1872138 RepID=UPI002ED4477D
MMVSGRSFADPEVNVRRLALVLVCFFLTTVSVPAVATPREQPAREDSPFLNPNLVQVAQVPGRIQDFSDARVLYLDSSSGAPRLKVRDRGTGMDMPLPLVAGRQIARGWLTPRGVFLRTSDNRLYEWTGGEGLTDLGAGGTVLVRGPYAAWENTEWSRPTSISRRDFATGQTVEVARARDLGEYLEETFVLGDLADNGDVVYSDVVTNIAFHPFIAENWISRYRDGVTDVLVGDDPRWDKWSPVSDGTTVVYRKTERIQTCPACGNHMVALHDGTREFGLTARADTWMIPNPGSDYDVAGRWAAYTAYQVDGEGFRMQVWRRSPDGALDKLVESPHVGLFARPLSIVSLGEDGTVLYSAEPDEVGGPVSLYLSAVGQPPVLLASGWGGWTSRYGSPQFNFVKSLDARGHLVIAGTLYALTQAPPLVFTVEIEGQGAVTVDPYGQTCRTSCTLRYAAGAEVTLTAAPDPGWRLEKWSGACAGSGVCALRLLAPATVHARFFVPARSTPPVSVLPRGRQLSAQTPAVIPVVTSWTSTSVHGAISAVQLQVSVNDGGFAPVPLPNATTSRTESTVVPTASYRFRARGVDAQGRPGDWSSGNPFTVDAFQETAAGYSPGWTTRSVSSAWGGSLRSTNQPSASATVMFTGSEFAIVGSARLLPATFDVYIDGTLRETVHNWSILRVDRRILAAFSIAPGTHTVRIVRTASSYGPLEVDGFVVLR